MFSFIRDWLKVLSLNKSEKKIRESRSFRVKNNLEYLIFNRKKIPKQPFLFSLVWKRKKFIKLNTK